MVTALEELEFDVVCMFWYGDEFTFPWIDVHLVTWLSTGYILLVRLSLGFATGCLLCMQAPHSRNSNSKQ